MSDNPKVIIYGDGVHDDTEALQKIYNGEAIADPRGKDVRIIEQEEEIDNE